MIDQDMLFRAGLLLSVIVLAGVFGTSLAKRMEEEPIDSLDDISRELGTLIRTLHQKRAGSYVEISFGDQGPVGGSCTVLPSSVNGRHFNIELRPGAIAIRMGEHLVISATGPWIVPTLPPIGPTLINSSVARGMSVLSGGFTVSTPVILKIICPGLCSDGRIHIYPADLEIGPYPCGVDELESLLNEPGKVLPGWRDEACISCSDIMAFDPPIILLKREDPIISSGSCPLPIIIPWETIDNGSLSGTMRGSMVFFKEAILTSEGDITFSTGVELRS
ncbi:MAG: hypothetical protein JXA22_02390 [Candidatus Thermoplasmatota archaeon]|nr:hypothetical protein [Candidatus Thermoplasmatota archaeon]